MTTGHNLTPDTSAVVYSCARCWSEFFPDTEPGKILHDARLSVIHADHASEFVNSFGFIPVGDMFDWGSTVDLFCPHINLLEEGK